MTVAITAIVNFLVSLLRFALMGLEVLSRPALRIYRLASLRSQSNGSVPVSTQFDGTVSATGTGRLVLGEHCRLGRGVEFDTTLAGHIGVGGRVRINTGTIIVSNSRVTIGDDTLIGEYVSIRDANHGVESGVLIRTQLQGIDEIRIGRDVWIGRGCCILKGVTIGDGAVIGANSVVTRDIPPGLVCAGAPAKQIGTRSPGSKVDRAHTKPSESTHGG